MARKRVLVVEDTPEMLQEIVAALAAAKFDVTSAATVAQARSAAAELGERLDVAILDMRLDDQEAPNVTGADIGIEIRSRQKAYPPEFMINSIYALADYYRLALELGAAVYLQKVKSVRSLVQHTQVLALRRALSINRPGALNRLNDLAEKSRDEFEAVSRLCQEVVHPELASTLTYPYLLLLTGQGQTVASASRGTTLPLEPSPIYQLVQARTLFDVPDELRAINVADLKLSEVDSQRFREFEGAYAVTLADVKELRLTLVLLRKPDDPIESDRDPKSMAEVMSRYFRSPVLELLIRIVTACTLLDGRRRAAVEAIADFCDRVGDEQDEMLAAAFDNGEIRVDDHPNIGRLLELGGDVRKAGNILHDLAQRRASPASGAAESWTSGAALIRHAWQDFLENSGFEQPGLIQILSDVRLAGGADDLRGALSDVLEWLASRANETPPGVEPAIRVHFEETAAGVHIVLEDSSRRLDPALRAYLFRPFASQGSVSGRGARLGLYLAKIEIEVGHLGTLEDQSDGREGGFGHRLVVRLPAA